MPQANQARKTEATTGEHLSDLVRRRYRQDVPLGEEAPWAPAIDTLLGHHSARAYLPDALPEGTLELIVAAAQSAPTSSNLQSWSVVAVTDPERKKRLAALTDGNRHIEEAPLLLVWLADLSRLRHVAQALGQKGDALDHFESFLIAALDASFAAQNAVVAIEALGLGSCYIGGIRREPVKVADELGLPPETLAVFGLTVGWPDPARASDVKPRLPQSTVLHRERYAAEPRPADLAAYNEALRSFQHEQNLPPTDWTEQAAGRIGTANALKGREKLTSALQRLGFKLL